MDQFMNYDFNIAKIVVACFVPGGTGNAVHNKRQSHGLALNMGGEKIYAFSNDEKLTVQKNDIIYLPKDSSYTVLTNLPGDCYAINFELDEMVSFSPFVYKVKNYSDITEHFRTASNVWQRKSAGYTMRCKIELYQVLCALQQEFFAEYFPKTKLEMIQPAVDYIHRNYVSEAIRVEILSGLCGVTPEYFRKIFKSFYGVSPVKYINGLKISRAKELLESQIYSVTEAALQSGFTEMSYFSREFKKVTGSSPMKYKKDTGRNG